MKKIFISHASADKELIDPFVVLLRVGLNLKQEDIFCTSLEGMGIPRGSIFIDVIKKNLDGAAFVIMVLTPKYYESAFCLCEMGATWIAGNDAMPILVPPLEFQDLKAVLANTQAGRINDKATLNELRDRLLAIQVASGATHEWEVKRDAFIRSFPKIQAKLKGRDTVAAADFNALKETYDAAQETISERDSEIETLNARIEELERAKDRKEVAAIRAKYTGDEAEFERCVEEFRRIAGALPSRAIEALFHHHQEEPYVLPPRFGNEHVWENAEDARKDGYVEIDESRVTLREKNPKVKKAIAALSELHACMNRLEESFVEEFEGEHEIEFTLTSREFWSEILHL